MTIRTSSAREIDTLLLLLHSQVAVERDAAVARLRILGARARDRVLALAADHAAPGDVRAAALKVVDVDDPRARRAAIAAAGDSDLAVAEAAVQVLRPWLSRIEDTAVLECISSLVADQTRPRALRRAALEALSELPAHLTRPLVESVAAQLAATPPLDDAATALEWLEQHGDASLGVLHDLLIHARTRQQSALDESARTAWFALRAAVHAVLAGRGSLIALYDVRELFEHAEGPLPLDLLVTMKTIGDLSCLEAMARAWQAAAGDAWWRAQVKEAAAAVVAREKATSRSTVVKRVRAKWPGFLEKAAGA